MSKRLYQAVSMTFAAAALLAVMADAASAQGRYANRYSKRDVSDIIGRLETSSDEFRRDFDRAMDNSNMNGSAAEERYNNIVRDFENSVDRLRRRFDGANTWWQAREEVQNMVRDARPVNTMMTTLSFRRNIERQWNRLRNEINTVADTFDLPGLGGGGWNGGGNSGGNWGGGGGSGWANPITPPEWAQGTFSGTGPYGVQILLTIGSNGSVTALVDGGTSYGSFTRGNVINLSGATARVTRQGTGILTVNTQNGERISYTRSGYGDGGYNAPGNRVRPPAWARGTFFGTAPNGARINLTISAEGDVTANVNGQTSYGSYTQGNVLSINGAYARVTSTNRGITTVNTVTGETIVYRRE
jgi:hypothetical protein